jgi:hypothetical protein
MIRRFGFLGSGGGEMGEQLGELMNWQRERGEKKHVWRWVVLLVGSGIDGR